MFYSGTAVSELPIPQDQQIHPAAVGGAGVQRDDAGAVIGAEIRVRPELGAAVLIDGMAIGAMPVAAEDRLFLQAGLGRVHAVTPPRPAPFRSRRDSGSGRLPPESWGSSRARRHSARSRSTPASWG